MRTKQIKMQTYRQGDVLLIKVNKLPISAKKQVKTLSIVLGEGETAGHRHEILETSKLESYRTTEGFYLDVQEETYLIHPEHDQVALLPGTYQVIRQVEFKRKENVRVSD